MAESTTEVSRVGSPGMMSSLLRSREIGALAAVLLLIAVGILINAEVFLSSNNILNVVRNTAVAAIVGYGMVMLMVSGEFDLSVGATMALGAGILTVMVQAGYPFLFGMAVVLVLAALYGIFQGLLVTKLNLPSLIVTIGTMTLLRGVLLLVLGGVTLSLSDEMYPPILRYFGGNINVGFLPFGTFPMQILWVVLLLGLMYYVLTRTPFGNRTMFTGGSPMAADRAGINTDFVKTANFMLVAVLAAFAGIGQLAFTRAVSPSTGNGLALIVIASVVIGGTDLFGGEGSIPGAFLGASVFALTQNILVLAGMGVRLFQIFTGLFIISAVLIEVLSRELRVQLLWEQYLEPFRSVITEPGEFFRYVRHDIQGVDDPLVFQSINGVLVTLVTLLGILVLPSILGGSFSFFFVGGGLGALGTVPTVVFVMLSVLTLFTAIPLHIGAIAMGSEKKFTKSLQAVLYSLAPAVLLFIPILLAGLQFISVIVAVSTAIVVLPVVYLLFKSTQILHETSTRGALVSVAVAAAFWALVIVFTTSQLSAVA